MRTVYNIKKIGAVGYCFGGKYVVRHLRPDAGKIDIGYTAHPSFVEEAELIDMKGPLAISAAETDQMWVSFWRGILVTEADKHSFPAEKRHRTEEILKELKLPYQINLYSGVAHGFAVRGDMKVQAERYAKESAFLQALQWFEEHMK
jgi:dienelactone hydrolase